MEKEKREEKQKEQNQEIEDFGQVTLEEGETSDPFAEYHRRDRGA